jgi:hypothetical protein
MLSEVINERIATKTDLKDQEMILKYDIKELEKRLTIRLGVMMAASIAISAALIKFL